MSPRKEYKNFDDEQIKKEIIRLNKLIDQKKEETRLRKNRLQKKLNRDAAVFLFVITFIIIFQKQGLFNL